MNVGLNSDEFSYVESPRSRFGLGKNSHPSLAQHNRHREYESSLRLENRAFSLPIPNPAESADRVENLTTLLQKRQFPLGAVASNA